MSKELVASSKIKIEGCLINALAIPILCACPPEILLFFSPINASIFKGKLFINSSRFVILKSEKIE